MHPVSNSHRTTSEMPQKRLPWISAILFRLHTFTIHVVHNRTGRGEEFLLLTLNWLLVWAAVSMAARLAV